MTGAPHRAQLGREPVRVGPVDDQHDRDDLPTVGEVDPRPQEAQYDEERSVGHALQVTGQTHPRILRRRHGKAGEEAQQKENQTQCDQQILHGSG